MAQATAVKTYDAVGNREDLTDVIAVVARDETPIYSGVEKVKAKSTLHEWQTDALSTGNVNAKIEGADFGFALATARTRLHNHTQIFTKSVEVSGTQDAVDVAGLEDEYAYQLEKAMKEIATDIEKALITGTGNSGASGTEALTESMYNDLLQTIYSAGGRPDTTYVNGFQKRKISAFASNSQRYFTVDAEGELKNSISVYESDFGRQRIELDPFMDADKIICVQKDLVKVAVLRGIKHIDVAVVGDAKRGALVGELTLELRNELGCGKITQLTTA